jgi:hypothetical protein
MQGGDMVRTTYILAWIFFILACVERAAMISANINRMALEKNVLPRNFFELSLLFFVAAIASERCCPQKE